MVTRKKEGALTVHEKEIVKALRDKGCCNQNILARNHEDDERRYRDHIKSQRVLNFMTSALVVDGVLQVAQI